MMNKEPLEIPASERYIAAVRRWWRYLRTEPQGLMAGSLWFVLTALPIITYGLAWTALVYYMHQREQHTRVTWREACGYVWKGCGTRSLLMGGSDLLALLLAGGCVLGMTQPELPMVMRLGYALFFMADVLYMLSALYRYPAMMLDTGISVPMAASRGVLMSVGAIGWTLMLCFVALSALLVCTATGVGLPMLYPAISALLAVCAYDEMAQKFMDDQARNNEAD